MTDRTYICSSLGQTDVTNLELLTAAIISIWSSCLVRRRARERGRCTRAADSDRALSRRGGCFNALWDRTSRLFLLALSRWYSFSTEAVHPRQSRLWHRISVAQIIIFRHRLASHGQRTVIKAKRRLLRPTAVYTAKEVLAMTRRAQGSSGLGAIERRRLTS